ncbi:MAG: DUF2867 domain-containing protein [Streptosporangiaceae bacterium]
MRLPDLEYTSRPWRIHELTRDFRVEDVWALPVAGGRDDFPRLVAQLASADPSRGSSRMSRMLWRIRGQIGEMLRWDGPEAGLGSRVRTLRERLPAELRSAPGPGFAALPFTPLYLLGDEFAAEIANRTVHAVMHVGWVPDGDGAYRGQLAVLVKPNGMLGAGYLAAIRPFRNLIVYPRMMRDMARRWRPGAAGHASQVGLPPAARALSTLSRIDYEDAFFVRSGPDRTGEQWARVVLEGAPQRVRARLLRGWCLLGLRLGSPSSRRRVLGWQIRRSTPDFVLLAAGSRIGMPAELLFKCEPDGLLFATFVQQRNSLARAIWARVVPVHQRTVRSLLTHAARADPGPGGNVGRA